eukprot:COSAG01_NODE_3925_length_5528_cov_46.489225_5_plen_109_part_00
MLAQLGPSVWPLVGYAYGRWQESLTDALRQTALAVGWNALPVCEVGSARLGGRLYSSGRSAQPVWEVNSTRLGGRLNSAGKSTQPGWEVNSTRLGGQLYSAGRSTLPV